MSFRRFISSVIAAVKSEASADELSTPYKRILLSQIQQRLANSVSEGGSVQVDDFLEDSGEALNMSADSAMNHRKKARPTKYVTDELFECIKCTKRFEHQLLFEQHYCCKPMDGQEMYPAASDCSNRLPVQPREGSEEDRAMAIDDGEDNSLHTSGAQSPASGRSLSPLSSV